jgi:hypothetical protein
LAIYGGEVDELRALLMADAGLATRVSSVGHPTLLQLVACEEPNISDPLGAAEVLVDAGASTHSPLVAAAGCDSRAVLEFLLDRGVHVDGEDRAWTPLDEAVYWANIEIVERLLARGARVRALSTAAGLGDSGAIERFVGGGVLASDAGPIGSPFPDTILAAWRAGRGRDEARAWPNCGIVASVEAVRACVRGGTRRTFRRISGLGSLRRQGVVILGSVCAPWDLALCRECQG